MDTPKDIFAVIGILATILLLAGIFFGWLIQKWQNETPRPTTESDQLKAKQ